jgi:hypothetical protein
MTLLFTPFVLLWQLVSGERRRLQADNARKLVAMGWPTDYYAFERASCPNSGPKCMLVSDGDGHFCCRTCGVSFVPPAGAWYTGDWHGEWPWDTKV